MPLLRSPNGAVIDVPTEQVGNYVGYEPVEGTDASRAIAAPESPDRGVLGGINAAATGILSGATLGLSDYALKGLLDKGESERLAAEREGHPIASAAGQVAGAILPAVAAPGSLLGSAPSGLVSHALAPMVAEGRAIGGAAGVGRVLAAGGIEGAAQNAGMYLSDTALGDRELSAEGLAASLGPGFAFGVAGGAAALGIEHGTIAARRLFSRVGAADKAALEAESAWQAAHQSTLEANDAAADMARARLAETRAAREQAQLAKQRAKLRVVETEQAAPQIDATYKAASVEREQVRDAAKAAYEQAAPVAAPAQPIALHLHEGLRGLGLTDAEIAAMSPADLADAARLIEGADAELAAMQGARPPLPEAKAAELEQAVAEHDAARAELDDMLRHLEAPDIGPGIAPPERGVPIAPGAASSKPIDRMTLDEVKKLQEDLDAKFGSIDSGSPEYAKLSRQWDEAVARRDHIAKHGEGSFAEREVFAPTRVTDDELDTWRSEYRRRLTDREVDNLVAYSSSTYKDLNRGLRHGSIRNGRESLLGEIDNAIAKSSLPRDVVVYRGLSGEESKAFRKLEVGDAFVEKAYTSTSVNPNAFKREVNLHIEVPKGYQAAAIPSGIRDEKELLLRRHTKYVVTGVADDGTSRTISVRVVPDHEPLPALESMTSKEIGRQPDAPPIDIIKGRGATDTLTGQMRAMQSQLGAGADLKAMGAPARAEYAAAKAERTAAAADHFRAQANAKNYAGSQMAADEAAQQSGLDVEQSAGASERNPRRVAAARKAAAASIARQREIHSAVASNLSDELQVAWSKDGYKFMREEASRIRGNRDAISAASDISEAFTEKYGAGSETLRGYEGDRYHRRLEIEARHAEQWAKEQSRKHTAEAIREEAERVRGHSADLAIIAKRSNRSLEDVTELWQERAAIHEFEGGASRADAEKMALDDISHAVRHAGDAGIDHITKVNDDFFANLTRPKTRDAYVAANIGRAMREEGSHAAALAKVEREWAEMGGAAVSRTGAQNAVEDVAAAAEVVTKYERASAKLTEALGPEAPPAAQEAAKAFRAAEDHAERKQMARTTRAIDDSVDSQGRPRTVLDESRKKSEAKMAAGSAEREVRRAQQVAPPAPASPPRPTWEELEQRYGKYAGQPALPPTSEEALAAAKSQHGAADVTLQRAKIAETEARIGSRSADDAASSARAAAEAARPLPPAPSSPSTLGSIATAIGIAGEVGIPGVPHPKDIPVIGPLLSMYLKYKALKYATGRMVGRVSATGDARAAALVTRTKEKIAVAVDRTLGLVEAGASKGRGGIVAAATVLGHRVFDDGEPDAPKGANAQQLAAVRIREIANASTRPDLVSALVRKEMRGVVDPDLIEAAEKHLMARFEALAKVMPTAPPPNPYSKREWLPSPAAAYDLSQRLAVVHDPEQAFINPTPAKAQTAAAVYPKLLQYAQQRLMDRIGDASKPVPYEQRLRGSLVFKVPLDDSLQPDHAAILATAHAPSPITDAQPAPQQAPTPSIAANTNLTSVYQTGIERRAMR